MYQTVKAFSTSKLVNYYFPQKNDTNSLKAGRMLFCVEFCNIETNPPIGKPATARYTSTQQFIIVNHHPIIPHRLSFME